MPYYFSKIWCIHFWPTVHFCCHFLNEVVEFLVFLLISCQSSCLTQHTVEKIWSALCALPSEGRVKGYCTVFHSHMTSATGQGSDLRVTRPLGMCQRPHCCYAMFGVGSMSGLWWEVMPAPPGASVLLAQVISPEPHVRVSVCPPPRELNSLSQAVTMLMWRYCSATPLIRMKKWFSRAGSPLQLTSPVCQPAFSSLGIDAAPFLIFSCRLPAPFCPFPVYFLD